MRGRAFIVRWREEDTTGALKGAYQKERDIELRTRLHGLWLLRSGMKLSPVAGIVGVHRRTVQTWVRWYRDGGVPSVLSHKKGGKGQEAFLTDEAQQHLAEEVSTGRFRTAEEVRNWVAHHYGVTYSKGGMYNLLHRLRCSPKVPRPIHAKADQQQQAEWKKGGYEKP